MKDEVWMMEGGFYSEVRFALGLNDDTCDDGDEFLGFLSQRGQGAFCHNP